LEVTPTVHLYKRLDAAYSRAFFLTTITMMMLRRFGVMFAAVGLAYSGLVGTAHASPETLTELNCRRPVYPDEALHRHEVGVVLLGFLIRTDGTVAQSTVMESSGSRDLDTTSQRALSKCVFKRAEIGGQAIEHWQHVLYTWTLDDDPELKRPMREAVLAAKDGDASAYYRLSLMLLKSAKTEAARERAFAVLRQAAERGHPHAQYQLGKHYEAGLRVPADIAEAVKWYEAAAKQNDVFALQRLKWGKCLEEDNE
jgi:TonB family protein